ncbi:MFS transporter [Rhizobium sp. GR12]|uniref:MFS transporter n=1 Tax=Rhizobium sp. GR12 TaxID=3053925 RepID=UPI002FBE4E10
MSSINYASQADAQPLEGNDAELKRVVAGAAAGSVIEWFEFSVYGYLAAVMGKVFFTTSEPRVQIIASFAAFAVAFLARPFGGIVCGALGDRIGRKRVLNLTLFVMAASTFAIGLVPGYASIGIAAPIALTLLRLLQGLSAGGEVGAAAIFVAERCGNHHRTRMTAWVEVGCMAGFLMGAVVAFLLHSMVTDEQLVAWAWRVPFYFAAPLALVGLYIRYRLEESPLFMQARKQGKVKDAPLLTKLARLRNYKGSMLQAAGMVIGTNVTLFTVLTYLPTYLNRTVGLTGAQALAVNLIPMTVLVLLIPPFASIADRTSRKSMMLAGLALTLICAVPAFHIIGTQPVLLKIAALVILNIGLAMLTACIFAQIPSLFPVEVRFMAMAVSYNVTIALFAGTAPLINSMLVEATGDPLIPAYYMMVASVLGIFALLSAKDRTGKAMNGD